MGMGIGMGMELELELDGNSFRGIAAITICLTTSAPYLRPQGLALREKGHHFQG